MLFKNRYLIGLIQKSCLILVLLAANPSISLAKPEANNQIRVLVQQYYSGKALQGFNRFFSTLTKSSNLKIQNDHCPPSHPQEPSTSCVDSICKRLSKYDCDDLSDLGKVNQICASQANGGCIDLSCNRLSKYDCDDLSDFQKVGKACEGQYGGRCLNSVCNRLSKYDCDDISDLEKIGKVCQGFYDSGCIESVCSRLSKYDCDDLGDLEKVVQSCKGN